MDMEETVINLNNVLPHVLLPVTNSQLEFRSRTTWKDPRNGQYKRQCKIRTTFLD